MRRALRAVSDLPVGHVLRAQDLQALRPCPSDAIDPRAISKLVGRTLARAKAREEAFAWADLA